MAKEIRVLILEDNSLDAELVEHTLLGGGLVFTSKIVDTNKDFQKALDEFIPDIILSDYDLPTFDGLEALRIAKEKCPDVPFILVTGRIGEEFAIETLKKGVTDYVMKGNLKRLVSSISRAIEEAKERAEHKQAEEALRFSEERYRGVVENIGIGVSLISPNMEILALNKQMKTWFPHIDVSSRPICYRAFNDPPREEICSYCPTCKTLQDGQVHEDVTETPAKDNVISFRIISSPVKDQDGKVIAAIEMVEDITERKRTEEALNESEERYRILLEKSFDGIFIHENFKILDLNQAMIDLTGYSQSELLSRLAIDLFSPESQKAIGEYISSGSQESYEIDLIRKDGSIRHMEVFGAPCKFRGRDVRIVALRDITKLRKTEKA